MSKAPQTEAHFDAPALLAAVAAQDVGLRVTTNNPEGFRRIVYLAIRRELGPRCHIYRVPRYPDSFFLLRQPAPDQPEEIPNVAE